jgi:aryl-alcohol dehydrogenase-like predicted oxidoreductase
MEYVRLGASGLKISRVVYGNWFLHGWHDNQSAALAAREPAISTFDTADACASTEAESFLGGDWDREVCSWIGVRSS